VEKSRLHQGEDTPVGAIEPSVRGKWWGKKDESDISGR